MTALAKDRKSDQLGAPDTVLPVLLSYPVAAATKIYGGALVAINASGYAVPASATASQRLVGRAEAVADNSSGAAGDIAVTVHQGVFWFNQGTGADAIVQANVESYCYASDDNTVCLTDAGGTRPLAGVIKAVASASSPPSYPGVAAGQVAVYVGASTPYAVNPELGSSGQTRARGVLLSVASYAAAAGVITASANGAIGTQDGLTLAAGDIVILPPGVAAAAKDSGVYTVTSAGSLTTKFVLTRLDVWPTGATLKSGAVLVTVGGEGTTYKNTTWRVFVAADTFVVDTDDPKFYPVDVAGTTALVAGTFTLSLPVFSAKSTLSLHRKTANTCTLSTGGYHPTTGGADGITVGAIGTGAIVVEACVAAGTINVADISTLHWKLSNQA